MSRPDPSPPVRRSRSAGAVAVMAVFALWSGLLAVGFAATVVVGLDELGAARVVLFTVVAALLAAAAARTVLELVRGPQD